MTKTTMTTPDFTLTPEQERHTTIALVSILLGMFFLGLLVGVWIS